MPSDKDKVKAEARAPAPTRLAPVGFWSYARQDDQLSDGRLSQLRTKLVQELQQQYGREPVRLFQDAETIPHGSNWEQEISRALNEATFFIPIITPNFVQSEWCAREVELFLEREAALREVHPELKDKGRIFPILFIGVEDIDPENPEAFAALEKLQWFDFRPFRHRGFDEAPVREAIENLAGSMRTLLRSKPGSTARRTGESAAPERPAEPAAPTTVPPARPIEVGDVLNHIFEVKRFIKAGGMGQVFEGSNVNSGERVAVKALLPALAADPKVIEMFQREALTLTRLSHEALVQYRVLAREPERGNLYIVTEFIDGVDLGEALDRVDRSEGELRRLLARLAAGLAAAHRLGAIHRDISPDNVMLPGGDIHEAKIIDFGIAKDLGGNLPTLIGQGFAGKLNYVAPEQLGEHGGEIGAWTDVYSLGLLILSVAGGKKVDMSGSFADAIRKRREGPDLSAAPAGLRPLLADMLKVDPAQRLRSMDAVIARLAAPAPAPAREEAEPPTIIVPAPPAPAPVPAPVTPLARRPPDRARGFGGGGADGPLGAAPAPTPDRNGQGGQLATPGPAPVARRRPTAAGRPGAGASMAMPPTSRPCGSRGTGSSRCWASASWKPSASEGSFVTDKGATAPHRHRPRHRRAGVHHHHLRRCG
ncbi:protein kinase domain-containing protein [Allosphingosinicella sp.]|uniref:protein kinase domain-containing protein n=1 Tax=Allosphingosinicella sp. TaxID=2823234 RepID=UPI003783C705